MMCKLDGPIGTVQNDEGGASRNQSSTVNRRYFCGVQLFVISVNSHGFLEFIDGHWALRADNPFEHLFGHLYLFWSSWRHPDLLKKTSIGFRKIFREVG